MTRFREMLCRPYSARLQRNTAWAYLYVYVSYGCDDPHPVTHTLCLEFKPRM